MKKITLLLGLMLVSIGILLVSCKDKDNEDVTEDVITEMSEYVVYQDGTMLSVKYLAWPDPSYALYVPAEGATYRIDDTVNWMTGIELLPQKGENCDYVAVKPYYVNDNGRERIDYFDITFQPNDTGKKRQCGIRTTPFEAIEMGDELIFVGTSFTAYQESRI